MSNNENPKWNQPRIMLDDKLNMQDEWVLYLESQRKRIWYLSWESFLWYLKMWFFSLKNELRQSAHIYLKTRQSDDVLKKALKTSRHLRWSTSARPTICTGAWRPSHIQRRTSGEVALVVSACAGAWRLAQAQVRGCTTSARSLGPAHCHIQRHTRRNRCKCANEKIDT